jgi:hypothetical protein
VTPAAPAAGPSPTPAPPPGQRRPGRAAAAASTRQTAPGLPMSPRASTQPDAASDRPRPQAPCRAGPRAGYPVSGEGSPCQLAWQGPEFRVPRRPPSPAGSGAAREVAGTRSASLRPYAAGAEVLGTGRGPVLASAATSRRGCGYQV